MIKEKIVTLLDFMTEEQAKIILEYIQDTFELKQKSTWVNIEEDMPTPEEIEIINSYYEGDEDYKPAITHEQIKKEYNIRE